MDELQPSHCCQVTTFTMGSAVDRLSVKWCKILEFHFSHVESNIGAKTVEEYQNMFRCYLVKIDLV